MEKFASLSELQNQYEAMVRIAIESDYDLTPEFQRELNSLMQVIKALGGKV